MVIEVGFLFLCCAVAGYCENSEIDVGHCFTCVIVNFMIEVSELWRLVVHVCSSNSVVVKPKILGDSQLTCFYFWLRCNYKCEKEV